MNTEIPEPLAALSSGALDLTALWLRSGTHGAPVEGIRELELWLCSVPEDDAFEQQLSGYLVESIRCMEQIRQGSGVANNSDVCELTSWNDSIRRLIDAVPSHYSDWCDALGTLCESGDRMLGSLLGNALSGVADIAPQPPKISYILTQTCDASQRWCHALPVPPARGRSLVAGDYVRKFMHQTLDDCLSALASTCFKNPEELECQVLAELSPIAGTDDDSIPDRIAIVIEELATRLQQFNDGWPVETAALETPVKLIVDLVASKTLTGRHSLQLRDAASPVLEAITEILGGDSLSTHPSKLRGGSPSDTIFSVQLNELMQWLNSEKKDFAASHLKALSDAPTHEHSAPDLVVSKLLDIVVGLNRQLCEPTPGQDNRRYLRIRIHDLLRTQGFIVVEQDIIGRPVSEVRDFVSVSRSYPTASFPSDHIIGVRQPGYLFREEGGQLNVVRPAEVDVSD